MKFSIKMVLGAGIAATLMSCSDKAAQEGEFKYLIDEFADLKIMRYQVPGWDALTLQQKEYVYHLAEAAKYGRDIIWMQNNKYNLDVRKALENILVNYDGDRTSQDWADFETYAKRVFFSNGIHHHYAEDKFFPECPQDYFASLMTAVGDEAINRFDESRKRKKKKKSRSGGGQKKEGSTVGQKKEGNGKKNGKRQTS